MKKNLQTNTFVLAVMAFFLLGCGMFGGGEISNQQISDDLISKGEIKSGNDEFDFAGTYSSHCFKKTDNKIEGGKAEITIFVSAGEVQSGANSVKTIEGELKLNYNKNGDKWVLENLTPKSIQIKTISTEKAMKEFAPGQKSICSSFSRPYGSKK
jgi:hypothetical protein